VLKCSDPTRNQIAIINNKKKCRRQVRRTMRPSVQLPSVSGVDNKLDHVMSRNYASYWSHTSFSSIFDVRSSFQPLKLNKTKKSVLGTFTSILVLQNDRSCFRVSSPYGTDGQSQTSKTYVMRPMDMAVISIALCSGNFKVGALAGASRPDQCTKMSGWTNKSIMSLMKK